MRATLNIPDELIGELMRWTGQKTKTKAICEAIEEHIRKKKIDKLLSLSGKLHLDLDWEKMEEEELKGMKEHEVFYAKLRRRR
ncbi:MAG: type II toxin-antitoxin system VapB family antitoxin [Nitrospirae bacterium]|nr:type II toxin-antitoxin system VapB family antitoxin [Nitrospirota bacterium]